MQLNSKIKLSRENPRLGMEASITEASSSRYEHFLG